MNHSFISIAAVMITTSLVACGSKSLDRPVAIESSSKIEESKPKPSPCRQARQAAIVLGKNLSEYEKGVLYAYYCK